MWNVGRLIWYVVSITGRNVDDITRFSGLPQRKQLTYAAKQLIAREVNMRSFVCL